MTETGPKAWPERDERRQHLIINQMQEAYLGFVREALDTLRGQSVIPIGSKEEREVEGGGGGGVRIGIVQVAPIGPQKDVDTKS